MRWMVVVALAFAGCPTSEGEGEDAGPLDAGCSDEQCGADICDDGECRTRTCEERLGLFFCDANSTLTCVDPGAEADPGCSCDPGFANFDDATPGCEDPSPEYEACCTCLANDDSCLDTSGAQCVTALEAGATVSVDIGRCTPPSTCPGDCARVNCDNFGCTGY